MKKLLLILLASLLSTQNLLATSQQDIAKYTKAYQMLERELSQNNITKTPVKIIITYVDNRFKGISMEYYYYFANEQAKEALSNYKTVLRRIDIKNYLTMLAAGGAVGTLAAYLRKKFNIKTSTMILGTTATLIALVALQNRSLYKLPYYNTHTLTKTNYSLGSQTIFNSLAGALSSALIGFFVTNNALSDR